MEMKYLTEGRASLIYNIPLAEVVTDYCESLLRLKGTPCQSFGATRAHTRVVHGKQLATGGTVSVGGVLTPCERGGAQSSRAVDQLKSKSKGYASMEYKITGYRPNDLVKLEIKINGELAEPLSIVVHRDAAYRMGRGLVSKLKELIPRQMFRCDLRGCLPGLRDG